MKEKKTLFKKKSLVKRKRKIFFPKHLWVRQGEECEHRPDCYSKHRGPSQDKHIHLDADGKMKSGLKGLTPKKTGF